MRLVPSGSFEFGYADGMNFVPMESGRSEALSVESFYMCDHEVTNGEYKDFLEDMKFHDKDFYQQLLPDTMVWRDKRVYNEMLVKQYLQNPEYNDYPVVGVDHMQAMAYCDWLTDEYMNEAKRKFKTAKFKLPSKVQWTYAACGGHNLIPFPWLSYKLVDSKGALRANFSEINQANIGMKTVSGYVEAAKEWREYDVISASDHRYSLSMDESPIKAIKSYQPNDYKLYDMAGNVEEMVAEFGVTKGGSWFDTGFYLRNQVEEHYTHNDESSAERGFRIIMEVSSE